MFREAARTAQGAINAGGTVTPAGPSVSFSAPPSQITLDANNETVVVIELRASNLTEGSCAVEWVLEGTGIENLATAQALAGTETFEVSSPLQNFSITFKNISPTADNTILRIQLRNPVNCDLIGSGGVNILIRPPADTAITVNPDNFIVVRNTTGNILNVLANDSPTAGLVIASKTDPSAGSLRIAGDQLSLIYDAPNAVHASLAARYRARLLSSTAEAEAAIAIEVEDLFAVTGTIEFNCNTNETVTLRILDFVTPAGRVVIANSPAPSFSAGSGSVNAGNSLSFNAPSSAQTVTGSCTVRHTRTGATLLVNFSVDVDAASTADELPAADRIIYVDNAAELRSVFAATSGQFETGIVVDGPNRNAPLRPGDHVIQNSGTAANPVTMGGTFNFNKSGTAPTNANRVGKPIVVRCTNLYGMKFTGEVNLTGINVILYKADLSSETLRVVVSGAHSMLFRCRCRDMMSQFTTDKDKGGDIMVSLRGNYPRLWYCEFTNWEGRAVSNVSVGSGAVRYPHLYRCYWHDNVVPPTWTKGNGREAIQFGQTQGNGTPVRTYIRAMMEYCVLKDLYNPDADHDESESPSNKSSGNVIRYNSYYNCRIALTIRFGLDCEIHANYFDATSKGIIIYGDDHKVYGNYIENGIGSIRVFSGTQTMDLETPQIHPNGPTNPDSGNITAFTPWGGKAEPDKADEPVARNCHLAGNRGTLHVGEMPREYARLRVIGCIIEQHTGTINTERTYTTWGGRAHSAQGSSWPNGHREYGTEYNATAVVTIPTYDPLDPDEVGPRAPWVAPTPYPVSL